MAYQNIPGEAPGNDGGVTQIFRRIFAATYLFSFTWWELVALAPLPRRTGDRGYCGAASDQIRRFDLAGILRARAAAVAAQSQNRIASLSERLAPFSGIAS